MIRRRVFGWQTSNAAEYDFRIGLPFPLLDPARFEYTIGEPGPDIHNYDVVFAHRLAGRSERWLKLCADPNVLTVYDMDDDILCVDPSNRGPYSVFHPLEAGTRQNVLAADIVTVSSPGLLERYRAMRGSVTMLPICIPDDMPDWPVLAEDRPFTVGWAGSLHKVQDWPGLAEDLVRLKRIMPSVRFRTYGGNYTRGLLGDALEHFPYVHDTNKFWRSLKFDVGLAPLVDTPFNAGKCHTKLIEYGARHIPTVASNIGQYGEWIEHSVNGFLVDDHRDWVPRIMALADPRVREKMAAAAHESARAWTFGKHIHRWEQTFEGVVV